MAYIPRYIDDPPQIFFWEIDEFIVFSCCFGLGILIDRAGILTLAGIAASYILARIKSGRADGFFLHVLYWHFGLPLRGVPPSHIRTYIE